MIQEKKYTYQHSNHVDDCMKERAVGLLGLFVRSFFITQTLQIFGRFFKIDLAFFGTNIAADYCFLSYFSFIACFICNLLMMRQTIRIQARKFATGFPILTPHCSSQCLWKDNVWKWEYSSPTDTCVYL